MKIKGYRIAEIIVERDDLVIARAIQESLDRTVFLKILPQLAQVPDIRAQFAREAKLLAKLNHPNIVTIHEFNAEHDPPYLVLEYFQGQDLSQVIRERGPLAPETLLSVMQQAVSGCAKAHAAGILHRDLKPANLLIDHDGQVKLSDFGLAALLEQTRQPVAGSPGYLAPELALGAAPTRQTDIYALGMTFYTLAVGANPLIGQNLNETLNLAIKTDPEKISRLRQDIPDKIAALIHRMISKDEQERFQDCDKILERLRDTEIPETDVRTPERGPLAFQPRFGTRETSSDGDLLDTPSRKDWLLGLAFFVLLVIAIYSWSTSKRPDSVKPYPTISAESSRVDTLEKSKPLAGQSVVVDSGVKSAGLMDENASQPTEMETGVAAMRQDSSSRTEASLSEQNEGTLFLAAIPWARIRIDSVELGATPFSEPLKMAPGRHTVHFLHPDYPDLTKSVEITAGKTDSVWLNWRSELGFLAINVFPWADVYVNSEYVDVTPIEKPIPLQPGEYQLLLKNPDFSPWHRFVQINAGDTFEITARLGQPTTP